MKDSIIAKLTSKDDKYGGGIDSDRMEKSKQIAKQIKFLLNIFSLS